MLLATALPAWAGSPALSNVLPRGGQRGTEVEVTLTGDRLDTTQDLFLYHPGLSIKALHVVNPKEVKATFAIAADARLGEHALRVRTSGGISELRTFWVGALPIVEEVEPNNEPAKPQPVELNITLSGVIKAEDVDSFAITLKKGQRINAEVEGIRLGGTMFDPHLRVLGPDLSELASVDDSALLLQDPVASLVAPQDGAYIVQVRDSAFGGNDNARYRLHLGTFPRPGMAYPAGGQAGEVLTATLVGDVAGPISQALTLPSEPTAQHPVIAQQDGLSAPSPVNLRVSPFGAASEVEPNGSVKTATPAGGELPRAFNGVIDKAGDEDYFAFTAAKGQVLDLNVYARRLRSPLDPLLNVFQADGKHIEGNDDTNGPDSYYRFTVPADGAYALRIRDHLGQGGPDYVYRVEVTPVAPKLELAIPLVARNSQERQTVAIPRGNRFATLVRATRSDFGGAVKLAASNLPKGVTMSEAIVADGLDVAPVVFEAAADAPTVGTLTNLTAAPEDLNIKVRSEFVQAADLVVFGNAVAYYQAKVDKLAVAVVEEAPFKLNIVQPKAPLLQSGSMPLKVVAERKAGFTGPINLSVPWAPPGVSAGGATIPANATEATIPLNATADASVKTWKICVLGNADVSGPVWVSTQLADLVVAPPLLAGKIEMAAGERGKPVQVICTLEPKSPFDGKATIELLGLPANTTSTPREITAADKEVIFDVQTSDKSPAGQHKALFCAVTAQLKGEPVHQTLGSGGVLRIDPPAPQKTAAPVVAAAPTTRPVSRLEKLRQEQAARAAQQVR